MSSFDLEDVIRYAEGDMLADEKLNFEEELKVDRELQNELQFYRQYIQVELAVNIKPDKNRVMLEETLDALNQQYFKSHAKRKRVFRMAYYWSAAAVIFMALLIWAPWNRSLFDRYAETEMVSFVERGGEENLILQKATTAFNQQDFITSGELLRQLIEHQPDNDMLKYYYGVSLVHLNELPTARKQLSQVYQGASLLREDAAYYMALSFLKEKNETDCIYWLKKISAEADVYQKAQNLLKELR